MGKIHAIIILIVFVLVAAGLGFFVLRSGSNEAGPASWNSASSTQPGAAISPTPPPPGFKEYKNTSYAFSLFYPPDVTPKEYEEQGEAHTVVFEDLSRSKGFQIFITPYTESQITPERFKMDVPSGVMREPHDIYIDGTRATMFYSEQSLMGETREVWFIKGGYLYEVVTYKKLDPWLAQIMGTWKFI